MEASVCPRLEAKGAASGVGLRIVHAVGGGGGRVARLLVLQVDQCIFFFQAEDGIRDDLVTGVQTCALPISIDSSRPNTIIAIAFSTDPLANTTAKIRPSTISEKYSAGPNASASFVSGAPSTAISTVATQPAKNEPIAAIASAGPARPCLAIWKPSSVVTTEGASPGILTRIEGG